MIELDNKLVKFNDNDCVLECRCFGVEPKKERINFREYYVDEELCVDESKRAARHCLTLHVELAKYAMVKDNEKCFGLKQYNNTSTGYYEKFEYVDFFECKYSKISYDWDKQIFCLEQIIDGKVKKGFVCVSFNWQIKNYNNWLEGYIIFNKEIDVPCEYDELEIVNENLAIGIKDGVEYNITFKFPKSSGNYSIYKGYKSYDSSSELMIEPNQKHKVKKIS